MVHNISGTGFPLALQNKVMFCPSLIVTPFGLVMIEGSSEETQKRKDKHQYIKYFGLDFNHPSGREFRVPLSGSMTFDSPEARIFIAD